jgi:FkbM family methyltransferase
MRLQDIIDYFELRQVAVNAWDTLRFRKNQRDGQVFTVQLRNGKQLYIRGARQDYNIFRCIFLKDEYRLNRYRDEGWGCIVDIGANVGFFSARAAEIAERVISYEPVTNNFEHFRQNAKDWPNIEQVQMAVAGRAGRVRLFCPLDDRGTGRYSKYRSRDDKLADLYHEVQAITINELFEQHSVVLCDLLKLDVEGAEYEILYSATKETLSRVQRIHAEYHDVNPQDPSTRIDRFMSYVRSHGFDVTVVPERGRSNKGLFFASK